MRSYFFILGNNPALSIAEILNKFQPKKYSLINKGVLKVDFEKEIKVQKAIEKIGGTIKIAEFLEEDYSDLLEAVEKYLPENFEGKYKFGFSFYGEGRKNFKEIAMAIKKKLRIGKISSRWIISRDSALSSVVVSKNKLIETEGDFVVIEEGNKKYLGVTRAVQDFEKLSLRDYGRPMRDSHSGMIPPKLAQIMLNIGLQGKTDRILLDPFCGSGTILMEAGLMGVKKIIGTDLSEKAIKDSQINLRWAKNNFQLKEKIDIKVEKIDVRELSDCLEEESVDLIVTEPFLGPQRKVEELEKAKKELEVLYNQALSEFQKVLRKNGRVVMIWPVLRKTEKSFLNLSLGELKIVDQIPTDLKLGKTKRGTIIYGRKGQRVWREIVVLEK